jgi:hypothetical protein
MKSKGFNEYNELTPPFMSGEQVARQQTVCACMNECPGCDLLAGQHSRLSLCPALKFVAAPVPLAHSLATPVTFLGLT